MALRVDRALDVVEVPADAIESGAPEHLREELGDLLFQVVFHARLGEERGEFTMAELLRHLIDKMVSHARRLVRNYRGKTKCFGAREGLRIDVR